MRHPLLVMAAALVGLASCHFEGFDERCAREAQDYTLKHCPRRMDECTVMDSMSYHLDTRTLLYYYTLEGKIDDEQLLTHEVTEKFREQLLLTVQNSVELKAYKEKGVNFCYVYHSSSQGKQLFSITVTADEYGYQTTAPEPER